MGINNYNSNDETDHITIDKIIADSQFTSNNYNHSENNDLVSLNNS